MRLLNSGSSDVLLTCCNEIGRMSMSAPVSGVMSIRTGCGLFSLYERIERDLTNRGQFDLACPVQHQQKTAADHIAQRAVGLFPLPCFAQSRR